MLIVSEKNEIIISRGDADLITFDFGTTLITDTVVLSIKRRPERSIAVSVSKEQLITANSSVSFRLDSSDYSLLQENDYYYDLYLKTTKSTLIPPTKFTIMEVVHNE